MNKCQVDLPDDAAARARLAQADANVEAAATAAEAADADARVTRSSALGGKAIALEPSTGFSFDSPLVYRPR